MTADSVSADAVLRSAHGVISRRVSLIDEKPPRWLELEHGESIDLYLLVVEDPTRLIYLWQASQRGG